MKTMIQITQVDAARIQDLLLEVGRTTYRGSTYIRKLKEELERAEIISPQDISADVITMHSTAILLDINTGERQELTLVYPEEADVSLGRISVLAPIGAAMLGYREGDTFTWDTPGGLRSLKVEQVLAQPKY